MWDCNYKVNPWNSLAILLYLQDDLTLTLEQDQSSSLCTQSSLLRLTTLLLLQVYYLMGTQLVISIRGKITEETSFLLISLPTNSAFFHLHSMTFSWPKPNISFLKESHFPTSTQRFGFYEYLYSLFNISLSLVTKLYEFCSSPSCPSFCFSFFKNLIIELTYLQKTIF